jgi:hypothetical protein
VQTILLENYTTKQHKSFTQSSRRNTPDSWGKPHQDSEPQTCPPTHNRKVANSEKTKPKNLWSPIKTKQDHQNKFRIKDMKNSKQIPTPEAGSQ